jgi:hypothetical protein
LTSLNIYWYKIKNTAIWKVFNIHKQLKKLTCGRITMTVLSSRISDFFGQCEYDSKLQNREIWWHEGFGIKILKLTISVVFTWSMRCFVQDQDPNDDFSVWRKTPGSWSWNLTLNLVCQVAQVILKMMLIAYQSHSIT